jgi:uncharacterized OB-fold protein
MFRRGLNVGWPKGIIYTWFAVFVAVGFALSWYRFDQLPLLDIPYVGGALRWVGSIGYLCVIFYPAARRAWLEFSLRNRLSRGRCVKCGYDLVGTPMNCPECGRRVPRFLADQLKQGQLPKSRAYPDQRRKRRKRLRRWWWRCLDHPAVYSAILTYLTLNWITTLIGFQNRIGFFVVVAVSAVTLVVAFIRIPGARRRRFAQTRRRDAAHECTECGDIIGTGVRDCEKCGHKVRWHRRLPTKPQ